MDVDDLVYAARVADLEFLDEVIEKLPSYLGKADENGNTALHMACANGHTEVVQKLLPHLKPDEINSKNSSGNTPLHWAAMNGHVDACKLLLDNGGDPHVKNNYDKTCLYEADIRNKQKVMELFLDYEIAKAEADTENGANDVDMAS
ncbi:ribosome biogenesis protein Nop8 [Schizosaccharomyces japonicus yFS275]|uniref:Ribosome biogenesis protein Nop8 n=1 Tax=Schizosaccharomyces japonicus (strain yFS275 / FY16936) TaxID=402676 RepID=B6K7A2_SCHJY|nr:ribosome biogenesis protein Nop8 [Schizosaccharomyces japonicus yFS275]EEB09406.1 ribosome biogenesis protein Nop8 [Schizosaccharomyces japonicus yFS275]